MSWEFELIAGPYGGTAEGPAWDGLGLLFTHIPTSRILRYDPATGQATEHISKTGNANGLMLDSSGQLYACQGGARRVVRYEADGFSPSGEVLESHRTPEDRPTNCTFGGPDLTTLYVTTGDGHLFRTPTDRQGRLWFPKPA